MNIVIIIINEKRGVGKIKLASGYIWNCYISTHYTDKINQLMLMKYLITGIGDLVLVVLNVENVVCEEQNFVNVRNEVSLFQAANEATNRNVICKHNTSL